MDGMSNTLITAELLAKAVDEIMPEVITTRRYLHQHPELSGQEEQTALLAANGCRKLGLKVQQGIGARLETAGAQRWIALRSDMDALPIQDAKQRSYASRIEEVSHACGHDAHVAIMLGVAHILSQLKEHLSCNIAFVFQPAEESCEGAAAMLRENLFETIKPEQIYALHVYPYLPAGSIGLREGAMCAAADMFDV